MGILKSVAHDLLNENALAPSNKRFIEKLLQIDERGIIGYERLVNPDRETYDIIKKELGLPVFIKPANMGSSVGVSKVRNESEFKKAVNEAFLFDKTTDLGT